MAWKEIKKSEIPNDVRFQVLPQDQGQIVEVAYSVEAGSRTMPDPGDARFQRVHDRSIGPNAVWYYRRDVEPV